jgi:hypothetical protein
VAPHAAAECSIVVRDGGRWYDLMDSDDAEPRWTTIANIAGVIPRGAFLPRSRGLEIARSAVTDGPVALRAAHQWRPVPSWVVDRGDYQVRDIVEALVDDAHAEIMSIVRRESMVQHPPAGVRRLAYLLGVHNKAMADGLDAALEELPPDWWYEAIAACDELGLADVAALLRRLDPDEPDFELSDELFAEYDRLTASREWHGDDAIRSALRRRVGAVPEEYGVQDVPPPPPAPYDELTPTGFAAFLSKVGSLGEGCIPLTSLSRDR